MRRQGLFAGEQRIRYAGFMRISSHFCLENRMDIAYRHAKPAYFIE
jgi:hypothetical protein